MLIYLFTYDWKANSLTAGQTHRMFVPSSAT